jgi:hydroxyacylglutathione hydrolase
VDVVTLPGHNPGPWTGAGTNTYLLTGRVPTLIDAGVGDPRHLQRLEDALSTGGRPLAQVLVTHGHVDHASGAPALARRWPQATFRKMPWPGCDGQVEGVVWHPLRERERVAAGDGSVVAIHTPGHAPDHVCFLDEASGTLFCGDLAIEGGTVVIPASREGRLVDYLASLERVRALAPRRLLAGHGAVIEDPEALLTRYLAHRQRRERQILDALGDRRGVATDGLLGRIYGTLPSAVMGAARESLLAHLAKLEAEGRVRSSRRRWVLADAGGDTP